MSISNQSLGRTSGPGPTPNNIRGAISLLDDWESGYSRLEAAKFLAEYPKFEDSAISRIWSCIYQEKKPEVIATLITTLSRIGARSVDSIPLIAYHLNHQDHRVVLAATGALCQLSGVVQHAWLPLLTAQLTGAAELARSAHLRECERLNDVQLQLYARELDWICSTPRQKRAQWLNELPRTGLSYLSERDRARFFLLYADPNGEHVWGCLKVIVQSQRVVPDISEFPIERCLSACEGSFFREIAAYGEPVRARFLAQALAHSRPFTASLAHPLGEVDLHDAHPLTLRINATAVRLAPRLPPARSLQMVVDGLWYESEEDLRSCAIVSLRDIMPELGQQAGRHVIESVFQFLNAPADQSRAVIRDVAAIITTASRVHIPFIIAHTQRLVAGQAPKAAKTFALGNLARLQYDHNGDPNADQASLRLLSTLIEGFRV